MRGPRPPSNTVLNYGSLGAVVHDTYASRSSVVLQSAVRDPTDPDRLPRSVELGARAI